MTSEVTRLRALCERAALPACEAQHMRDDGAWCVVAAQGERRAIVAEVTWALPEPLASDRVTEARAKLYALVPAAILGLCDEIEARDRELAETQRRTVELEAALIEARGERDDLRAVLETRDAEVTRAVAAEREACAVLCDAVESAADAGLASPTRSDGTASYLKGRGRGAALCAEKIRARGEGGQ